MEEKYKSKTTCEKTNLYCDRSQYGEIEFWARLKMKFHLLFCGPCQKYSKKNAKLTRTIKKAKIVSLKRQEIHELKQRLVKKMNE